MFGKIELRAIVASVLYHVAAVAALCVGGLVGWLALVGGLLGVACVWACVAECKNGGRV